MSAGINRILEILGDQSSSNQFDSTVVASSRDGSLIEREEAIQASVGEQADAAVVGTGNASLQGGNKGLRTSIGDHSADVLTSIRAKFGNITESLLTLLGARADAAVQTTADASMHARLKGVITTLGDPSGDTLTSLNAKLGNSSDTVTDILAGSGGIATFPAGLAPANNVSLAEVIRATYNQTLNASLNVTALNYFTVTADMTSATWNTAASHEIATVTGMVQMTVIPQCTGTLTDAADGASIQFGVEGSTAAIIASTGAAGAGGDTIETGEFWIDATPADLVIKKSALDNLVFVVGAGKDVGYEITGAALTGGSIVFHCWWKPLDGTGAAVAGAGGAL